MDGFSYIFFALFVLPAAAFSSLSTHVLHGSCREKSLYLLKSFSRSNPSLYSHSHLCCLSILKTHFFLGICLIFIRHFKTQSDWNLVKTEGSFLVDPPQAFINNLYVCVEMRPWPPGPHLCLTSLVSCTCTFPGKNLPSCGQKTSAREEGKARQELKGPLLDAAVQKKGPF